METNLQIIKENSFPFQYSDQLAHLEKLIKQFPDRYGYPHGYDPQTLFNLHEQGFRSFVTDAFIKKFIYAASIYGLNDYNYPVRKKGMEISVPIIYIGDIPEFGLDKIKNARHAGLRYVSIHSNYPLAHRYLEKIDPIVVGWMNNPRINIRGRGWGREGQVKNIENSPVLGVVIVAWDIEKEIEFWK